MSHLPSTHPVLTILTCHINLLHVILYYITTSLSVILLFRSSIFNTIRSLYPLSLFCKCPNHVSLASLGFSPSWSTWAVHLMYIFLISCITPSENLGTFNSASCLLVRVTISNHTWLHHTSHNQLVKISFLSCWYVSVTSDTHLHPLHPAYTVFSCFHNSPAFYSHLHPFSPLYQGFFLLINGFGSKNGEKAVISVPVITRASPICVDFWYHMLGPSVSNLDLLVQTVCNLFNTTEPSVSGCALYHLQISSHSFT